MYHIELLYDKTEVEKIETFFFELKLVSYSQRGTCKTLCTLRQFVDIKQDGRSMRQMIKFNRD